MTRFDFAPGAETGWHMHGHGDAITAITVCHMALAEPDGATREVTVQPGESYACARGVSQYVINSGDAPMRFVEVELL